jgi:D-alanyl-D-alanine carboxypeptidase (penicillin-binding protein 5/6)
MSDQRGPDDLWQLSVMMKRSGMESLEPHREPDPADRDSPELVAARRRARRRRLIGFGIAAVVLIAAVATYVPIVLNAPIHSASIAAAKPTVTLPAAAKLNLPQTGESAISIAGGDAYLGAGADGIFASQGGAAAVPIASISKLITALVILQAKPLAVGAPGPVLTFDKADADTYDKYFLLDATVSSMRNGSSMNERDSLEAMLVASACNYAEVVSTWAYGSQARFLSATRTWLAAKGLKDTKMVEPTGIDARNVSTPADMIALAKIAMADPVVSAMVAIKVLNVPNIDPVQNTNDLLGSDGITGIKTGTLTDTGSNLLFSANVDVGIGKPLSVVGVVLGGGSHDNVDTGVHQLLASIRLGFHLVTLVKPGEVIGTYTTPWKDHATIVASKGASILTWSNTAITSAMTTKSITTGSSGTGVGTITWKAGPMTVNVPLELQGTIAPPSDWWKLTHPADVFRK